MCRQCKSWASVHNLPTRLCSQAVVAWRWAFSDPMGKAWFYDGFSYKGSTGLMKKGFRPYLRWVLAFHGNTAQLRAGFACLILRLPPETQPHCAVPPQCSHGRWIEIHQKVRYSHTSDVPLHEEVGFACLTRLPRYLMPWAHEWWAAVPFDGGLWYHVIPRRTAWRSRSLIGSEGRAKTEEVCLDWSEPLCLCNKNRSTHIGWGSWGDQIWSTHTASSVGYRLHHTPTVHCRRPSFAVSLQNISSIVQSEAGCA